MFSLSAIQGFDAWVFLFKNAAAATFHGTDFGSEAISSEPSPNDARHRFATSSH